ncbi:MAG: dodecin family protein [Porticoccaceae bacterium]|nr:dodecin family protein [Porticoccaceae bacterium]
MSVSSVSSVSAASPVSFKDALEKGYARASQTLRGIESIEIVGERAKVEAGVIKEYIVDLKIVFALEK